MTNFTDPRTYPTILDAGDYPYYFTTGLVVQLISGFTAIIVLMVCQCLPSIFNHPTYTLISWMSVSTIGQTVGYLLGMPEEGTATCVVQGFFFQFFRLSEIFAMSIFVRQMSLLLRMYRIDRIILTITWKSYLLVWGVPLISAIIALFVGDSSTVLFFLFFISSFSSLLFVFVLPLFVLIIKCRWIFVVADSFGHNLPDDLLIDTVIPIFSLFLFYCMFLYVTFFYLRFVGWRLNLSKIRPFKLFSFTFPCIQWLYIQYTSFCGYFFISKVSYSLMV